MRSVSVKDFVSFFFMPQGRIARREYVLGEGLLLAINASLLALLLTCENWATFASLLLISLWIPMLVAQMAMAAKRCHDLGLSGSYALVLALPVVGIFWLVALAFAPGNAGPNAYGPPPAFRRD